MLSCAHFSANPSLFQLWPKLRPISHEKVLAEVEKSFKQIVTGVNDGFQQLIEQPSPQGRRGSIRPGEPVKRFSVASSRMDLKSLKHKLVDKGSKARVNRLVNAVSQLRTKTWSTGGDNDEIQEPHQLNLTDGGCVG